MKILLVDDHPMVLMVLRNIIQAIDAACTVCTADTPEALFDTLAREPDVDLVLLDLMLGPAVDGLAVLADLRLLHPGLPVVVVSAVERLTEMVRVIDAGAMGFVPKGSPEVALQEALSMVLSGGVYIPPALLQLAQGSHGNLAEAAAEADARTLAQAELALARQRAAHLARSAPRGPDAPGGAAAVLQPMAPVADYPPPAGGPAAPPAPPAAPADAAAPAQAGAPGDRLWMLSRGLTQRQCDVLMLLLKGLPNKLIARELNLSVDTVKDHVAAVLRVLGVASRTQAVVAVGQRAAAPATPPG